MDGQATLALAEKLLAQVAVSESERSQRTAITSLTNLFFERGATPAADFAVAVPILLGLVEVVEDRGQRHVIRAAAIRSLERMLAFLSAREQLSSVIEELNEKLQAVARRRNDDSNLIKQVRDVVNRRATNVLQDSDDDTANADETQSEVCPIYGLIVEQAEALAEAQATLAARVSSILAKSAGYRPGSLDEGIEIAARVNELVNEYGLFLVLLDYPDEASSISFRQVGGTNPGTFILRSGASTRYGGIALPSLKALTPAELKVKA